MPDTPEGRERIARLEVQIQSLTKSLEETEAAVKELTNALHELKGTFRGAMWLGGMMATAIGAVLWAATWVYDKLAGAA